MDRRSISELTKMYVQIMFINGHLEGLMKGEDLNVHLNMQLGRLFDQSGDFMDDFYDFLESCELYVEEQK